MGKRVLNLDPLFKAIVFICDVQLCVYTTQIYCSIVLVIIETMEVPLYNTKLHDKVQFSKI